MRKRLVFALLTFLVLSFAIPTFALFSTSEIKLPTWPQTFNIPAGGRESFGFPVVKPGKIVADVTWTGKPLSVVLIGPLGKPLTEATARTSPVHIEYDVASVDPARGFVWTVAISDPGTLTPTRILSQSIANGSITVKYPEVDLATCMNLANSLQPKILAADKAMQDKLAVVQKTTPAIAPASTKTIETQILNQIKTLQQTETSQFTATATKIQSGLTTQGIRTTLPLTGSILSLPRTALAKPETVNPPGLIELVNLSTVYAGDEGYARVKNASEDLNLTQICFQMTPTVVAKATVIEAHKITSDITYGPYALFRIRVPEEVPGMQDMTGAMNVFARNVGASNPDIFADSSPRTVVYICRRPPRIDKASVSVISGEELIITGAYFWNGCTVHFVFPDGSDHKQTIQAVTSYQQIKTWIPGYRSASAFPVIMYIDCVLQGRTLTSNMFQMTFKGTEPVVTSITPNRVAPNGVDSPWITIRGTGLKRITSLHFEPDPGQESKIFTQVGSNKDFRASWGLLGGIDTEIYPRPPAVGGISASVTGNLIAAIDYQGKDLLPPIPFTMDPFRYSRPLLEPCNAATVFSKKNGSDTHFETINTTDPNPETHYPAYWWTTGWHYSSFFEGHAGDDIYVVDVVLKNGWTFEGVNFSPSPVDSSKGSRLESFWMDSAGRPCFKVHWWVDAPNKSMWYCATPIINGPRFVPYK